LKIENARPLAACPTINGRRRGELKIEEFTQRIEMNSTTTLNFEKPGLQTLVQDLGREGFRAFGVPVGGAMDRGAARAANWLVGNPPEAPVLEITLMGPRIRISGYCQIALTGADLSAEINGQAAPRYETVAVTGESVLSFGKARAGCRAYLAVGGEWQVRPWLGSCSASTYAGKELMPDSYPGKNSRITIQTRSLNAHRQIPVEYRPGYPPRLRVRVLPGPEFEFFSPYAVGRFFSHGYRLTADSNRMGFRLDAQILDFKPDREVISSGVLPGTIQVTNAGRPIILMADAQTTGGYYRLAQVISADMDRLAQLRPGDEVWFSLATLEEAREALGPAQRNLDG
jgi:biotin-dependent carboxylase-like uncharacterized protein